MSRAAVKNHANGAQNPKAHLGFECTLDDALNAPTVADPLNLYHCCPTTDGASAVLVASENVARDVSDTLVRVVGAGASSDSVGLFQRNSLTSIPASVRAGEDAYEQAKVEPKDLDFAEVHNCFAIAELLAYEDLRFCDRGEAERLLREGVTDPDGGLPTNTSGGLKSKGHPIGVTGTSQIVKAFEQFQGTANVQIDEPNYGLIHNVGGSGGGVTVHLFERVGSAA